MKWILILLLTLSVVVLGCNPNRSPVERTKEEQERLDSSEKKLGVWLTDWNEAMKMSNLMLVPLWLILPVLTGVSGVKNWKKRSSVKTNLWNMRKTTSSC